MKTASLLALAVMGGASKQTAVLIFQSYHQDIRSFGV